MESQERVDLPGNEQFLGLDARVGDPVDVLDGIEPDMSGHQDDQDVGERPGRLDADPLALQIGDAANAFAGEQFDAADHHAADHHDCSAGGDVHRELRCIGHAEIDFAPRDRRWDLRRRRIDKADIAKAFASQQFLGDVLRGIADALVFHQTYGCRFETSLGTAPVQRANEARRAHH